MWLVGALVHVQELQVDANVTRAGHQELIPAVRTVKYPQ